MYKKFTQAALILALSMVFLWLSFSYFLPISLPFLLGAGRCWPSRLWTCFPGDAS